MPEQLNQAFRTQTNSNFNTNHSNIVSSHATNQDYRTFGNPRERASPHMQRDNPSSGSRLNINQSHLKVKKGSQIDLHQLASRHGHNDSMRYAQHTQASARRQAEQPYSGPVIRDRRAKHSSISKAGPSNYKKSTFSGVSPASKQQNPQKGTHSKTRSRLGSSRIANNAGVAQSQNCSVNQSISIGGGATSHASNHGADRSPIRMRNVEDYSQVMQRLKQQLPSNNTPKLSRNKVQKHPTADRSHFATG